MPSHMDSRQEPAIIPLDADDVSCLVSVEALTKYRTREWGKKRANSRRIAGRPQAVEISRHGTVAKGKLYMGCSLPDPAVVSPTVGASTPSNTLGSALKKALPSSLCSTSVENVAQQRKREDVRRQERCVCALYCRAFRKLVS
jgi:hypothetical protein